MSDCMGFSVELQPCGSWKSVFQISQVMWNRLTHQYLCANRLWNPEAPEKQRRCTIHHRGKKTQDLRWNFPLVSQKTDAFWSFWALEGFTLKVMFKTNQKGTHIANPVCITFQKKQLQGVWCCVFVQRLNLDNLHWHISSKDSKSHWLIVASTIGQTKNTFWRLKHNKSEKSETNSN